MGRFDIDDNLDLDDEAFDRLDSQSKINYIMDDALKPFNPETLPSTFMYIGISGIINSGKVQQVNTVQRSRVRYYGIRNRKWQRLGPG